jgi:hypothetical protein
MKKIKSKQLRLSVPISNAQFTEVVDMASSGVDGTRSVSELVRKLLADRFQRFVAQRSKAAKPKPVHAARDGMRADLVVGKPLMVGKPGRKGGAGHGTAHRADAGVAQHPVQPSLLGIGAGEPTGNRAGTRAKQGRAQNRTSQIGGTA